MNQSQGENFVGFIAVVAGITLAYSTYKNKSFKSVLLEAIHPGSTPVKAVSTGSFVTIPVLDPLGGVPSNNSGANAPGVPGGGNQAQQTVLGYAYSKVGDPYLWSGAGPIEFDCSGLTMEAYKQVGYTMPHNAQAQYDQTSAFTVSAAGPGDLVFFGSSATGIHHVGLALGNGQMIDAPHTGALIRVEPYFSDLFAITSPLGHVLNG